LEHDQSSIGDKYIFFLPRKLTKVVNHPTRDFWTVLLTILLSQDELKAIRRLKAGGYSSDEAWLNRRDSNSPDP
jgi:hypothetical protein